MMMQTAVEQNLLSRAFDASDLERMQENIAERIPFYVRMQISSYEASAACLLHALVNGRRLEPQPFYSFFCSSTSESLSGALKVVRHNHHVENTGTHLVTAVYDPTDWLKELFDPMDAGTDEALVPGMVYFKDFERFTDFVASESPRSLLIRHAGSLTEDQLGGVMREASENGRWTILDESTTDLSLGGPIASNMEVLPDVVVFGENLADHKLPVGCFLMSKRVFSVWDNVKDYNLHSNTWGGNSASLSTALEFLKTTPEFGCLPDLVTDQMRQAMSSHPAATKLYETHCSPKMATMLNVGGMNKNIRSAYEARITTLSRRGKESVIDASGTYGVNLYGHNPPDAIDEVLKKHESHGDYWDELQSRLHEKAGFAHVIPAVSGATANEIGLTLSLLAFAPRKKIVVLKGAYAGKTLITLSATSRDRFKLPFAPLYPHAHYVDPFSESGEGKQQLMDLLATRDVAVVILETIQGEGGVKPCPQDFLDLLVVAERAKHGFAIAVDEVQTGMYRTGRFLNHQGKIDEPDIVMIGKALSNNMLPVSAVLVNERIYELARQNNEHLVQRMEAMYRCQINAHMANHAIQVGEDQDLAVRSQETGNYFRDKLKATSGDLSLVKDIRGEGLMIGVEFEEAKLPRLVRGSFGGLIASRCVNDAKQPVLVAFNPDKPFLIRFVPPQCITMEEIDAVVDTFDRALRSSILGLLKPVVVNTVNSKIGRF
ncbi:aminotransferase class III-fold pyridoxal phosphate-dependent enzyme [Rhodopirellula sallentina]|uniref:Acetylornithine transaminase n=1 Tax=Rhodopirellula sallentina SM41 TaxID=1263870 RepID=M5UBH3_9BACT|nr:aminotransferase class III-fold pyridoxal phosphate-dependent enzyme [Rhodopirellula sallentina]EMI53353.1 Acetylornithine transaminase [Rhodopirellula sallentina SM41]